MIKDGSNAMWSWVEIEDGKVIVIIITIISWDQIFSFGIYSDWVLGWESDILH